jgi:FolB domain-containing protein
LLISLKNLRTKALIGVYDWEQEKKQNIVINLIVRLSDEKSGATDELGDTLDYEMLQNGIIELVQSRPFKLIERMAQEILMMILDHPLIDYAKVEVDKPGALNYCDSVSVQIEKYKNKL